MPDMTPDDVKAAARAIGLTIGEEDIVEVTHRLNVIVAGVERFSHPDLDKVDPLPFRPLEEALAKEQEEEEEEFDPSELTAKINELRLTLYG